jgi:hypothetical protein
VDKTVMYGTIQNGKLFKTTNDGASFNWTDITPSTGSGAWISPFLIDPVNPATIYFGKKELFKSNNRGTSWSQITNNQTGGNNIDQIAVAPSNPQVIFFSFSTSLWKTINGGTSWVSITPPQPSLFITSILIDPNNANNIYLTYGNWVAGAKVYFSNNQGTSWSNFSGTLPNLPANKIIYQNGSNGGLYLAMDIGIYYRDNTKTDWALFNNNMPNVEIFDLEIRYSDKKLIAATYGRGLWESSLANTDLPPTVTTSAIAGITGTTATGGGNVTAGGSAAVTARGIVWSTTQNPTVTLTTKTIDGTGTGSFTSSLTGLSGGTVYYVRAYATSTAGTSYGAQVQFTTQVLPTVTTSAITGITGTTATGGGNVTAGGSASVTARGIVWSTTQNPTVSLTTKTSNGTGTGSFTSSLTGLSGGTVYYVRAYATSTAGTSYGAQV